MSDSMIQMIISAGVPTAVTGFLVWYVKYLIEKKDKEQSKREDARQKVVDERELQRFKYEEMAFRKADASLELAIATAKAIQRIPDAKCNGDMHAALDRAEKVKNESEDFLRHSMIINL